MERLGDKLAAETDAHERDLVGHQPLEQQPLAAQPAVPVFLIDVHRAAEDEHGAVIDDRCRGSGSFGITHVSSV